MTTLVLTLEQARANARQAIDQEGALIAATRPKHLNEIRKGWDPDANTPNTPYMSPKVDAFYWLEERARRRMGIMGTILIAASLILAGLVFHRQWVDAHAYPSDCPNGWCQTVLPR